MIQWNSAGLSILNDSERQLLEFHHKADAWPMTMHHGTVDVTDGVGESEFVEWRNIWLESSVDKRRHLLGTVAVDDN